MLYNANCRECSKEGSFESDLEGIYLETLKEWYTCEDCTEKKNRKLEEKRKAEQFRKYKATQKERFKRSGIPEELIQYDQEKGNMDLLNFVFKNSWASLFLGGATGIGKTRAVAYTAWKLLQQSDIEVRYSRVSQELREISILYGKKVYLADKRIKELSSVGLWILDDLGKEALTERTAEILYEIIDARYMKNLKIWITSNMGAEPLIDKMGIDRGKAIVRRLKEMCLQYGPTIKEDE